MDTCWLRKQEPRTKPTHKYSRKSSVTCVWASLLRWFICLQLHMCTIDVHVIVCTSEGVIFQPSDSAHKAEPNSYNVTLRPFSHLFDRPVHSVAMLTQSCMKQTVLTLGF